MTKNQRCRASRLRRGLCKYCSHPQAPGRKQCATHLRLDREKKRAWRRAHRTPRFMVTLDRLVADVQAVAQRLKIRRVSLGLYVREGSYAWSHHLQRRLGGFPAICAQAGLLAAPYTRGVDRRVCPRCRKVAVWYARHQRHCKTCQRVLTRRMHGVMVEAA